jgi:hypothetical protein
LKIYLSTRSRKALDRAPAEVKARLESAISDVFQTPLSVMGVCHLPTPGTKID